MNEQEFASQVGELATRIGYPIPSVDWSTDKKYRDRGIVLDPRSAFGPTLHVHQGVEHSMPAGVQEFLVAQEFLAARLGVFNHHRWLKTAEYVLSGLLGFAAVVVAKGLADSYLVAFLAGCAVATTGSIVVRIGIVAVWSRWFQRRTDRQLVELLGRDRVATALGWWIGIGWRPSFRWVLGGATPTAKQRLRRLDASITD